MCGCGSDFDWDEFEREIEEESEEETPIEVTEEFVAVPVRISEEVEAGR